MTYRHVATAASLLFAVLSIILLFLPEVIFWLFGMIGGDSALLLAKRAAMLMFGFSLITGMTRNHPPSSTRTALANALAVMLLLLAAVGGFEWLRGQVGHGIFVAIVTEGLFAYLFWRVR